MTPPPGSEINPQTQYVGYYDPQQMMQFSGYYEQNPQTGAPMPVGPYYGNGAQALGGFKSARQKMMMGY